MSTSVRINARNVFGGGFGSLTVRLTIILPPRLMPSVSQRSSPAGAKHPVERPYPLAYRYTERTPGPRLLPPRYRARCAPPTRHRTAVNMFSAPDLSPYQCSQ
ncbi:hypothetical protein GALMADRAFT_135620 [Galerina marginata CBS 339.88]|uniref:Uncharacterized protein n=1 Tax=Galerina marginata (strain CBS 339.88) TaxID=685588 RepID=A0A067TGH1_GALM3|nr:hypothetical protein GALMADRAFT_135620 [Galerina marginata CBS 339.88]